MTTTSRSSTTAKSSLTATRPNRLLSLDVLRGLTIAFMILVNNNGDETHAYWPLKHAAWNGFTPTDLVFPTFLFLVGMTTVFSTSSRLLQGATRQSLFPHVLRRSVILYLFGLVVNSFPYFRLHTMRFYGVLPRIAICYLIVASLYLISPSWRNMAALTVAALAGYWILMRFVPVPGYGIPTLDIPLLDRDANLTAWLDRQIFSASHLYERTRDPEGLLSTIPALATTFLGLLTGVWLRTQRTLAQKITGIAIAGLTGVLLGGLWNLSFPYQQEALDQLLRALRRRAQPAVARSLPLDCRSTRKEPEQTRTNPPAQTLSCLRHQRDRGLHLLRAPAVGDRQHPSATELERAAVALSIHPALRAGSGLRLFVVLARIPRRLLALCLRALPPQDLHQDLKKGVLHLPPLLAWAGAKVCL